LKYCIDNGLRDQINLIFLLHSTHDIARKGIKPLTHCRTLMHPFLNPPVVIAVCFRANGVPQIIHFGIGNPLSTIDVLTAYVALLPAMLGSAHLRRATTWPQAREPFADIFGLLKCAGRIPALATVTSGGPASACDDEQCYRSR